MRTLSLIESHWCSRVKRKKLRSTEIAAKVKLKYINRQIAFNYIFDYVFFLFFVWPNKCK